MKNKVLKAIFLLSAVLGIFFACSLPAYAKVRIKIKGANLGPGVYLLIFGFIAVITIIIALANKKPTVIRTAASAAIPTVIRTAASAAITMAIRTAASAAIPTVIRTAASAAIPTAIRTAALTATHIIMILTSAIAHTAVQAALQKMTTASAVFRAQAAGSRLRILQTAALTAE